MNKDDELWLEYLKEKNYSNRYWTPEFIFKKLPELEGQLALYLLQSDHALTTQFVHYLYCEQRFRKFIKITKDKSKASLINKVADLINQEILTSQRVPAHFFTDLRKIGIEVPSNTRILNALQHLQELGIAEGICYSAQSVKRKIMYWSISNDFAEHLQDKGTSILHVGDMKVAFFNALKIGREENVDCQSAIKTAVRFNKTCMRHLKEYDKKVVELRKEIWNYDLLHDIMNCVEHNNPEYIIRIFGFVVDLVFKQPAKCYAKGKKNNTHVSLSGTDGRAVHTSQDSPPVREHEGDRISSCPVVGTKENNENKIGDEKTNANNETI